MSGNKVQRFENVSDFEGIIANMDDYAKFPLFAKDSEGEMSSKRVYGICNMNKRHLCMPVSEGYPVFGHRQAYGLVAQALKERKVDCHGSVETMGDRAYVKILLNEVKSVGDNGGMEIGCSFQNPMDRKTCFRGQGYTFRQICSNGAISKSLLPVMEINESHTTGMLHRVPNIIATFIDDTLKQTNYMQVVIAKAMETNVKFESRESLEATMRVAFDGIADRHIKGVLDGVKTLNPTRFDLFNATTYYTSHSPVSPDIRERIDAISEKFVNVQVPLYPVPVLKVAIDGQQQRL